MSDVTKAQYSIVVLLLPLGGVQGGGVHTLTTYTERTLVNISTPALPLPLLPYALPLPLFPYALPPSSDSQRDSQLDHAVTGDPRARDAA